MSTRFSFDEEVAMMKTKSIRLSDAQIAKWENLAEQIGVTRNRMIGMLIEQAEVRSKPSISVNLVQNKSAAQSLAGHGAFVAVNP